VHRDGRTVDCAPPSGPPERWHRPFFGQVLPLAATLRGHEVFHASAVSHGDRTFAFVGPSGAGKTSLAAELACRGAGFVTDDVLALEPLGETVVAHAGLGVAYLRSTEANLYEEDGRDAIGPVVGHTNKAHVEVKPDSRSLPLGGVYFLERGREAGEPAVDAIDPVDPRMLLSNTFNVYVRTPERLVHQLDVCAAVARSAPMMRLGIPAGVDPAATADVLVADIESRSSLSGVSR
jgi:hypothetical protein